MSTLKATTIVPQSGTNLTIGASGDTLAVNSDSIKINTWKDSGGNTLWSSDGAGNVTNINTYISPSWKLIQTQEATTSNTVATIDFTTGIDSSYDKYAFVVLNARPVVATNDIEFNASIDSGATFYEKKTSSAFRTYNQESGSGALVYQTSEDRSGQATYQPMAHYVGASAGQCASGVLFLYAPSSTTYLKQFYSRMMVQDGSGSPVTLNDFFVQGYFENDDKAINAISFKASASNMSAKISLYGVC